MKKIGMFLAICLTSISLSACSMDLSFLFGNHNQEEPRPAVSENGEYQGQTAVGIWSGAEDFIEQLSSGTYYVVQDGYYFPMYKGLFPGEDDGPGTSADPGRKMIYSTEDEIFIPTLYEDCELVYYSETGLLDYITWERYYDCGYTLGLWDIKQMISERLYLDLDGDEDCIYPGTDLYDVYNLGAEAVMIDKIGQTQATPDLLEDGMFASANFEKGKEYDLAVYDGTYYHHYREKADIHAFKAYEVYASIEYETMQQENFYKVEIPEYLVTGYYRIGNKGMIRLVRGNSWGEDTDFNEQVLFPYVDTTSWSYDPDEYVAPNRYSAFEPLNEFYTDQEGKLGYCPMDEEGRFIKVDAGEEEEKTLNLIKEATVKEFEIWLPEGADCSIEIISPSGETTGDVVLTIDGRDRKVPYNRLDGKYLCELKGKGQKGTLVISGLFANYEVHLNGCEQYRGQDAASEQKEGQEEAEETSSAEETSMSSVDEDTEESEPEEGEKESASLSESSENPEDTQ